MKPHYHILMDEGPCHGARRGLVNGCAQCRALIASRVTRIMADILGHGRENKQQPVRRQSPRSP